MDRLKIGLAFVCIALGVAGYYYFSETAMVLRILMVLAGLVLAAGVAWMSAPGKEFFAFAQEAWAEAGRVAWPTRKETMQTTGIVVARPRISLRLLGWLASRCWTSTKA